MFDLKDVVIEEIATLDENRDYTFVIRGYPPRRMKVDEAKEMLKHFRYLETTAQHTKCAVCGEDKPTPIRNDAMGGYVCLTCVDKELERLQAQ